MALAAPGPTNVYLQSTEATRNLVVDFARNPSKFPVNQYVQVVPVTKMIGAYVNMDVPAAGRIVSSTLTDHEWADGMPRPEGLDNIVAHEFLTYRTKRYLYPFMLGELTIEQAQWDILATYARKAAAVAMTARTQLVLNALTTTGNYDATHVLDVTAITGNSGTWAASTTSRQDIKNSLNQGVLLILKHTLSAVNPDDLHLIISAGAAAQLSKSQELVDYIKGSPEALAQVRGELPGKNAAFGLPNKLYGVDLVVENTFKVTSTRGAATTTYASVLDDTTGILCSRPGGLEGVEGPSFSTCTLFAYEEMTVETISSQLDRRTQGSVVENIAAVMTAPVSGVLFQNITS